MVTSLPYVTETTREPSSGGQEINSLAGSCLEGSRRLWGRPCASSGLFAGGFTRHSHSTAHGRREWQAVCPRHQGGGTFPSSHMSTLSLLPLSRCLEPGGEQEAAKARGPAGLSFPHLYNGATAAPPWVVGPGQEKPLHNKCQVAQQQTAAGNPPCTLFWETAGSHRAHMPLVHQAQYSYASPHLIWRF